MVIVSENRSALNRALRIAAHMRRKVVVQTDYETIRGYAFAVQGPWLWVRSGPRAHAVWRRDIRQVEIRAPR